MLEHIERLKALQALALRVGIERQVHQNRLLKIAREGGQMTPADLAQFETQRRYATLLSLALEGSHRHRRNHRPARPHARQAVQCRKAQASPAVPGVRQGHQRKAAPVWAHRTGLVGSQAKWRRAFHSYRNGDSLGCLHGPRLRGTESSLTPADFDLSPRIEGS